MGKSKNKRLRGKKIGPTGLPSVRDIEKEEETMGPVGTSVACDADADMQTIQTISEQLQAVNVEDKECACFSLSNLIEKPETIPIILKNNVIKMVAPLLVDSSFVVRHAAAGTLRNLSVVGGPDVIDAMVENDVMTPLVALLNKLQNDWNPSKIDDNKIDTKSEIIVEATNLLLNLCESSNFALGIFNHQNLIRIIFQFLSHDIYGHKIAIAAAHCLHTVSEENVEAIEMLSQQSTMDQIEKFLQQQENGSNGILFRVLIAGIFLNTKNGHLSGCLSRIVSCILDILSKALSINCNTMLDVMASKMSVLKADKPDSENDNLEIGVQDKELDALKTDISNSITAQVLALEILTNLCCSDDSTDDWDDLEVSDASDEMLPDEMMDCDEFTATKLPGIITSEIQEALVSHKFVSKILDKLVLLNEDVIDILYQNSDVGRPLLKRITTLISRSLLCLHNLVPCLDVVELEGPSNLYAMWINIAQLAFKHTYVCPKNVTNPDYCDSSEHLEFLESVTSASRAVLQKIIQLRNFQFEELSWLDLHKLCELAEICADANIRKNIINTVGAIACHLANTKSNSGPIVIKNVGLFLLELCGRDTELIVMAEALDAIFDVYGQECTDSIAQEINLVERLKQILPSMVHKVNSQKKSLGIHYPVVTTARTNLVRFIKYKNSQQHCNNGNN